ncbi:MAG: hypothetical protein HBSAPP03_03710 [Phycisphaerae bacterium]|nr:MAG: hypothetical protein HBSAPP03_03710 [Phycisphaerae bacterium]
MSGITSGVGIFSGVDSASIIQQLLALEARPRTQAQARIAQLQLQSAAYLDINSRLSTLATAARAFREAKTFQTKSASSSAESVLVATAGTTAASGSFQFIVDRMVSTQQALSRGFANSNAAAVGVTSMTLETAQARLDRDVPLSDLNGGAGVERGRITITDSSGATREIDLSRATTVNEVLDAINSNGVVRVAARVDGGRLVIADTAGGGGTMTIASAGGYNTATSLGIAGSATGGTITGAAVYGLNGSMLLSQLNDGRGVFIKNVAGTDAHTFRVVIDDGVSPITVNVNLGDVYEDVVPPGGGPAVLTKTAGAVTTVQGVLDRMNTAMAAAMDAAAQPDVIASVDATTGRFVLTDTGGTRTIRVEENGETTAAELGLTGPAAGPVLSGRRVLAGLNTTLVAGLNGGRGLAGDGALAFTLRNGASFNVTLDPTASLHDLFRQIEDASDAGSGKRVSVTLDARGTGIVVTDLTGGTGNLVITGTGGADSAASLGISTGPTGVAASTVSSGNLQRQYLSRATRLSTLNAGRGIGTGTIRITDASGNTQAVTIADTLQTVGDLIAHLNSRGLDITARINTNGDGLEIVEKIPDGGSPAAGKIRIADESGSVARSLNIAGTAAGTGVDNVINGSFERTITFSAADTLTQVVEKLNAANAGVTAAIIQDGSASAPFRLSLTGTASGSAGRFIINSGSFDFGFQTLDEGRDARIFYGSSDPARGVAVIGSTNTMDTILPGVRIDLKGTSATPVTLTVQTDTAAIEKAVGDFVAAFNTLIGRIDTQSKYDEASKKGGPLLGDGTTRELRSALFAMVNTPGLGTTGRFNRLADVGIKIKSGGAMELDVDRFRAALQEDPGSVESLFVTRTQATDTTIDVFGDGSVIVRNPNAGGTFTALGVMGQFEELIKRYVDSTSGVLTGRSKSVTDQIALQNARIEAMTARLENRRTVLERQFRAMETAIGKLQGQSSALASLSGLVAGG